MTPGSLKRPGSSIRAGAATTPGGCAYHCMYEFCDMFDSSSDSTAVRLWFRRRRMNTAASTRTITTGGATQAAMFLRQPVGSGSATGGGVSTLVAAADSTAAVGLVAPALRRLENVLVSHDDASPLVELSVAATELTAVSVVSDTVATTRTSLTVPATLSTCMLMAAAATFSSRATSVFSAASTAGLADMLRNALASDGDTSETAKSTLGAGRVVAMVVVNVADVVCAALEVVELPIDAVAALVVEASVVFPGRDEAVVDVPAADEEVRTVTVVDVVLTFVRAVAFDPCVGPDTGVVENVVAEVRLVADGVELASVVVEG